MILSNVLVFRLPLGEALKVGLDPPQCAYFLLLGEAMKVCGVRHSILHSICDCFSERARALFLVCCCYRDPRCSAPGAPIPPFPTATGFMQQLCRSQLAACFGFMHQQCCPYLVVCLSALRSSHLMTPCVCTLLALLMGVPQQLTWLKAHHGRQ